MAIQRIKPLTVTEVQRRWMVDHGTGEHAIDGQELVTTSDQQRLFRHGTYLGSVDHGSVAAVAALSALYLLPSCARGVWPGDTCWVTDEGREYRCVSGSNATAVWRAVGAGVAAGTTAAFSGLTGSPGDNAALSAAFSGKAAANHTHLRSGISDSSPAGRALMGIATPSEDGVPLVAPDGSVSYASLAALAGGGFTYTPGPIMLGPGTYWCSAPGDTNGLLYARGVSAGGGAWVNPHTAGAVTCVLSSSWAGGAVASHMVDRAANYIYGNGIGAFAGVDLGVGNAFSPAAYTLRNSTQASYPLKTFTFEGSNSVGANTAAGFNAATWAPIDVRTGDATMPSAGSSWALYSCVPGPAYRWLRWRLTGSDSSGYLMLSEFELYDTAAIPPPLPFIGWATDGTHYLPYFSA